MGTERYVAWDIEIARGFPQFVCPECGALYNTDEPAYKADKTCPECKAQGRLAEWMHYLPLGVSCAATAIGGVGEQGEHVRTWYHEGHPLASPQANQMDAEDVGYMLGYLRAAMESEYTLVTWNGLGFDFCLLALEYPMQAKAIKDLAIDHVDIAFQMLCERGYMIGLDKAAVGLGLAGKTEGMHGDLAPLLWNGVPSTIALSEGQYKAIAGHDLGTAQERRRVIEYVEQDARTTAQVYRRLAERSPCSWISASGRDQLWTPLQREGRLLTVRDCLDLPEPKGWRGFVPRPRSDYAGWLGI